MEKDSGLITPNYQGTLSDNLIWNSEILNKFSWLSSLRTNITIKEGEVRPTNNYETLGDTLAWKGVGNPLDLFKTSVSRNGYVDVVFNPNEPSAEVRLNHYLIANDIQQASRKKFDQQEFVKRLNSATQDGIIRVLAKEKQSRTLMSALTLGLDSSMLLLLGKMTQSLISGDISGFFINPPTENLTFDFKSIHDYTVFSSIRFTELTLAIFPGSTLVSGLAARLRRGIDKIHSDSPYIKSFNDIYNPLIPPINFALGYLDLKTKTVVSNNDSESN
jgi:hypothetical protein